MMTTPWIRKCLDLSTAHLPKQYGRARGATDNPLGDTDGVIAYRTDCGFFMNVPSAPQDAIDLDVPLAIFVVMQFARSLDCDWVLFDCDGETIDDLPTYDW